MKTISEDIITDIRKTIKKQTKRIQIMGIINLTPDSFSGDGLLYKKTESILKYAEDMVKEGADIIDIGGESSRPGARPVSLKEELKRTIPVIERLSRNIKIPISIDTYKPEVAKQALESGASIVNDITGLRNPDMIRVVARSDARVIIMHMKGMPRDMQTNPHYNFLMDEIVEFLESAIRKAKINGIPKERIIIDPGIGFGKTLEHNLEILRNLADLKILGCPIMVGLSRKSFIGQILNVPLQGRLIGSIASLVVAIMNGADIVRVHDVSATQEAIRVTDAIMGL